MSDWDVGNWLQEIGFEERYTQAFVDNGYDQPNLCAYLKDEDLDAIEVDQEDRNRIFEHVERLRRFSFARKPISYNSPVSNGDLHSSSIANHHLSTEVSRLPDSFSASHEPSVKSPDSLGSVSHELTEHTPPSTTDTALYTEALKSPTAHVPKKPPRSNKKHKPVPLPLPSSGVGLSRLQLKLKLKGGLQKDHILISEPPYVEESGGPNEMLLQQLAVEYAEKFLVESLEMYEAVMDLWRVQNNRSDQATPLKSGDFIKLSPNQGKVAPVSKQIVCSSDYMDPYNGPASRPQRSNPHQRSNEKRKAVRSEEKLDSLPDSANGSITSVASSLASSKSYRSVTDVAPLSSPPVPNDIFLYEDVDGDSISSSPLNVHSRESSVERDPVSFPLERSLVSSESVPSLASHMVACDKMAGRKWGFRKILSRASKKKAANQSSVQVGGDDLMANAVSMCEEERKDLMEKFKKHELSENELLSRVSGFEGRKEAMLQEGEPPPLPPRSSDMMLLSEQSRLPTNNAVRRSQSSEGIDNTCLTSSGSSSNSDVTTSKSTTGMIASALNFFKKRKDNNSSKRMFGKSNLSHSSSMPAIVIEGILNEQNIKSERVIPPRVDSSAYSEVFDRISPPADSSVSQSTSLPRSSAVGNMTNSISSSTLPSRTSPSASPAINTKHSPSPSSFRYQQKMLQIASGSVRKTSPLAKKKAVSPAKPKHRVSSPEILTHTKDTIDTQRGREKHNSQAGGLLTMTQTCVIQPTAADKTDSPHLNKPAVVSRRPKIPPKPLPSPKCSNVAQPVARTQPVDIQKPLPRPRSRGELSSGEGRRSFSPPPVFDDEMDVKQTPPVRPPRRGSSQISSSSSTGRSDTPSPHSKRHTYHPNTALLTSPVEGYNGVVSPPPVCLSKPALPPKPRKISSMSAIGLDEFQTAVVERLNGDEIDLAELPYSTTWGECGIPVPLITRYAHEFDATFDEMMKHLDQIRRHRLEECQRVCVPMADDYVVNNQNVDTSSLQAWTISVGLPMYKPQLLKHKIRTVEAVKRIPPSTIDQIQFLIPLHAELLHKAILNLHKIN